MIDNQINRVGGVFVMSSPSNIQKGIYSDSLSVNPYSGGLLLEKVDHNGEIVFPSAKPKWPTPQVYSNPEFYHSARVRELAPVEGAVLEISTDGGETWSKCPVASVLNKDGILGREEVIEAVCRYAEDDSHESSDKTSVVCRNIRVPRPGHGGGGDVSVTISEGVDWQSEFKQKWQSADKSNPVTIYIDDTTDSDSADDIFIVISTTCDSAFSVIYDRSVSVKTVKLTGFTGNEYIQDFTSYNINSIKSGAFMNCKSLTEVFVPNCSIIESSAFYGCTSLLKFYNSSNIYNVGFSAFKGCGFLNNFLPINANLQYSVFDGCSNLKEALLFNGLGEYTFRGCTNMKHVILNEGVGSYIPKGCFSDCSGLEFVDFSKSNIETIEQNAFSGVGFSKCIFVFKDVAQYNLLAPQIGEDIKCYINNDSLKK